jgi:trimethylamine---corrinoid protein Co-methyltransferase
LAGANLIYGLGMLESGVTFDYGQLLMDCEFARLIKFTIGGIPVTDELLMTDDIHAVGSSGDFLSLDSTYKYMRAQSKPKLIDRRVREEWAASGSTDLHQRATDEARRLLASYTPEPLSPEVLTALRDIVETTEKELGIEPAQVAF